MYIQSTLQLQSEHHKHRLCHVVHVEAETALTQVLISTFQHTTCNDIYVLHCCKRNGLGSVRRDDGSDPTEPLQEYPSPKHCKRERNGCTDHLYSMLQYRIYGGNGLVCSANVSLLPEYSDTVEPDSLAVSPWPLEGPPGERPLRLPGEWLAMKWCAPLKNFSENKLIMFPIPFTIYINHIT